MNRKLLAVVIAAAVTVPVGMAVASAGATPVGFVQRSGTGLVVNGAPFRFFGANNSTLQYKPTSVVDSRVDRASGRAENPTQ